MSLTAQLRAFEDSSHKGTFLKLLSSFMGIAVSERDISTVLSFNEREIFLAALFMVAKARVAKACHKANAKMVKRKKEQG